MGIASETTGPTRIDNNPLDLSRFCALDIRIYWTSNCWYQGDGMVENSLERKIEWLVENMEILQTGLVARLEAGVEKYFGDRERAHRNYPAPCVVQIDRYTSNIVVIGSIHRYQHLEHIRELKRFQSPSDWLPESRVIVLGAS